MDRYYLESSELTGEEQAFLEAVKEAVYQPVSELDVQKIFLLDEKKGEFISEVKSFLDKFGSVLMPYERDLVEKDVSKFVRKYLKKTKNFDLVVNKVIDIMFSFGEITPLFQDPKIEEIMVNGVGVPVYVAHRDKGMCQTNIILQDPFELDWLARQFMKAGKLLRQEKPIYDGSLPDGTRFNIIMPPLTKSPAITIRRFTPQPFSILELVKNGTMNIKMAAFLWLAVEGLGVRPANIIISGGASSGKTTTLNALLGLVPLDQRIISIEDTPELNLGHRDNWIPMYTYYDFKKGVEVRMRDLVKASLRMRPDRIVVGEVRGEEAQDFFVAMDVGCTGSMGTLHANTSKEVVTRLTSPPMSVPETMLPLVDIIVVQQRMNVPGKGMIRRITEIVEVEYIDKISMSTIFKWDMNTDTFSKAEIPPRFLDKLSNVTGRSKKDIMEELDRRELVLKNMINSNRTSYRDVQKMIQKLSLY